RFKYPASVHWNSPIAVPRLARAIVGSSRVFRAFHFYRRTMAHRLDAGPFLPSQSRLPGNSLRDPPRRQPRGGMNFRSFEAVNGARLRAAFGGRRPLTASKLRKKEASMRSTALSAERGLESPRIRRSLVRLPSTANEANVFAHAIWYKIANTNHVAAVVAFMLLNCRASRAISLGWTKWLASGDDLRTGTKVSLCLTGMTRIHLSGSSAGRKDG